jgi:hypothetical protein
MHRSARARRARRRRVQAIGIGCVVAVVLGAAVIAVAESGGDPYRASGCAILDLSESTGEARTRYPGEFQRFATAIADEGSGKICMVLAGADPIAEAPPLQTSVAPDSPGTPKGREEIEQKVATATAEVSRMTENSQVEEEESGLVEEKGSGLVEAAVVAAQQLQQGDRILYLSDGLQWSPAGGRLMKMDLSPAGIAALIRSLSDKDLLPDLEGIEVHFPLMLYHPEGYDDVVAAQRVTSFWRAWADATGAELTIDRE